jgi:hypothetical protein
MLLSHGNWRGISGSLLMRWDRFCSHRGKSRSGTTALESALRVLMVHDRRGFESTRAENYRMATKRTCALRVGRPQLPLAKHLERLAEARLKDFPVGVEDEDQNED